jgi:hypothetical protein
MGRPLRAAHDHAITTEFPMNGMNGMNCSHGPLIASAASEAFTTRKAGIEPLQRQPWLLCAMVLVVAVMSSYVHVLSGQVERGERLRQGLAEAAKKPAGSSTHWLAEASQQPLATVGMGTGR